MIYPVILVRHGMLFAEMHSTMLGPLRLLDLWVQILQLVIRQDRGNMIFGGRGVRSVSMPVGERMVRARYEMVS
jgi:hypothetical protein